MTIAGGGREEQHQWEHADEQRGVSPGKMDAGVAHSEVAWRGGGRRNRGSAVGGLRKRGGQPAAAAVKGRGKDRRRCRPSDARPGRSSGRISETHREADALVHVLYHLTLKHHPPGTERKGTQGATIAVLTSHDGGGAMGAARVEEEGGARPQGSWCGGGREGLPLQDG